MTKIINPPVIEKEPIKFISRVNLKEQRTTNPLRKPKDYETIEVLHWLWDNDTCLLKCRYQDSKREPDFYIAKWNDGIVEESE